MAPTPHNAVRHRRSKNEGIRTGVRPQNELLSVGCQRPLASSGDQPSIGIILCKTRERFVAEYALRDINKPIGISEYRLAESLPEKLQGSLPTIEELENELEAVSGEDTL